MRSMPIYLDHAATTPVRREVLDAMLSLGQRTISEAEALAIVRLWLKTEFEGGRHVARIRKIDADA